MFDFRRLCALMCLVFAGALYADSGAVDLVIFSYNRPLQLYALLESIEQHVTGLGQTRVIYRADDEYQKSYEHVFARFGHIRALRQGDTPHEDFKPLTLRATFDHSSSDYILFAVDDIIVKDTVDLAQCVQMLEATGAYGFYLALGLHIDECYTMESRQYLPAHWEVAPSIYSWNFALGHLDWQYPHTVDMTIYRKRDIEADFRSMEYAAPNSLEVAWYERIGPIISRTGLFYSNSKTVNIPANIVQEEIPSNRRMTEYSPDQLQEIFAQGLKIDIAPLQGCVNHARHMEYNFEFIKR